MRAELIDRLLGRLGAQKIKNKGHKVTSTCPLAPWTHGSGRDEKPSFSVLVADNDESKCRCLGGSCNFKGTLTQLLWSFSKRSRIPTGDLMQMIQQYDQPDFIGRLENVQRSLNSNKLPGHVSGGVEVGDLICQADAHPWLENHSFRVQEMQRLMNDTALNYLKGPKRRLNDAAIERWRLGWHPGAQRISVPQYDRNKRLVNIGGRFVPMEHDDPFWTPPPWMHAWQFKKEMYLFGEDKFTSFDGRGTMLLVEGMFDAIYLDSQGISNVGAMLGAHLSKTQYLKIVTWFDKLVIVPDGDKAGAEAADRVVNLIGRKIAVEVYPTPLGKDPDELSVDEIDILKNNFLI